LAYRCIVTGLAAAPVAFRVVGLVAGLERA